MNRQTYLDAMGISRWRSRDAAPQPVVLCDDPTSLAGEPLVNEVLHLLGITAEQCRFANRVAAHEQVIWDLRLMNRPHKPGILYSAPLPQLRSGSEAKRALWQQVWQRETQ